MYPLQLGQGYTISHALSRGGGELSKKREEAGDETSEDDCDTKPCGDGRNDPIAS